MKITIDTNQDKHEISHLISLLRALMEQRSGYSGNIFDNNSPAVDSSAPSDSTGLFNLFDQPASSTAATTQTKEEKKDYIDQLQVY